MLFLDKWRFSNTVWRFLLVMATLYVALCFFEYMDKTEFGLLVVSIICVVNYMKASFETEPLRTLFSIMLLAAVLMWSLFGFLVGQSGL